jgi:hypothetical protein
LQKLAQWFEGFLNKVAEKLLQIQIDPNFPCIDCLFTVVENLVFDDTIFTDEFVGYCSQFGTF